MQYQILHILRAPLGGAFRHVCDLAGMQSARGLPVGLIVDNAEYGADSRRKLTELEAHCKLGVHRMPIPRSPSIRDIVSVRQILGQWRDRSPAVFHGHGAKGAAYARIIARLLGARSICTPHGGSLHYGFDSLSGAAFLSMERALKRFTGGMLFESRYALQQFEEKIGKVSFPHRIIYNGLHEAEFEPVDTESAAFDFLFIGEFRELKGIYTLLDAVQALRGDARSFRLLMAGSGPDEPALAERIDRANLGDIVTVSGPIHPARTAFAQARCLIAPSHKESMPYVVLEALAARMPIITTAVGGIPEIYGSMRELLLPAGDSHALSAAMAAFLDDPRHSTRAAAKLHGLARAHLSVDQMERHIAEFYADVIATPA